MERPVWEYHAPEELESLLKLGFGREGAGVAGTGGCEAAACRSEWAAHKYWNSPRGLSDS